jgi:hypothetical protein
MIPTPVRPSLSPSRMPTLPQDWPQRFRPPRRIPSSRPSAPNGASYQPIIRAMAVAAYGVPARVTWP